MHNFPNDHSLTNNNKPYPNNTYNLNPNPDPTQNPTKTEDEAEDEALVILAKKRP